MSVVSEDIKRVLLQARTEILANMSAKKINASRRTAASLQVLEYEKGVRLAFATADRAPMETLEVGRGGGRVPRDFTAIIEQWSRDKGLNWGDDKTRKRIAGAVAWGKIRRHGTNRHKQPVDVYSTPMNKAAEQIGRDIRAAIEGQIQTAIANF